jgi:two-component system LytT family response regulator
MKLRAIIVDDEPNGREVLARQLEHYCPEIELMGLARNGHEATLLIRESRPDVVFLDVEMGNETGFDLLKNLGEVKFDVVFTTAHEKYALEAIRFSALDYLMKPILADELKRSVSRLLQKNPSGHRHRHLDALIYNINYSNADKKIALPTVNGFEFISISELIRCEAQNNYTHIFLKNEKPILVSRTLLEFEKLLGNYYFFRIHQSHLINLRHVQEYDKGPTGVIVMSDGTRLEVSRRKKSDLMQALSEFSLIL